MLTSHLALKVKMGYQYWHMFKGNLSENSYESGFLRVDLSYAYRIISVATRGLPIVTNLQC